MRRNITICLLTLVILAGFSMKKNECLPSSDLVHKIQSNTSNTIKTKYQIYPCGSGASMPEGVITSITLCFDTKSPFTKNQLRKILLETGELLLNNVLINDEIQIYLKEKPFTIKNIEIIIYNNDSNGGDVFDPEISVARISQGLLIYRTTDVNAPLSYKYTYKESYEEALESLKPMINKNET